MELYSSLAQTTTVLKILAHTATYMLFVSQYYRFAITHHAIFCWHFNMYHKKYINNNLPFTLWWEIRVDWIITRFRYSEFILLQWHFSSFFSGATIHRAWDNIPPTIYICHIATVQWWRCCQCQLQQSQ